MLILHSVGCFNEVRYSLFLCFTDSLSPSLSQGKRFDSYTAFLPLSQENNHRIYFKHLQQF